MQSSLIGKIEKARRYSQEPERIKLSDFHADFRGEHSDYSVSFEEGKWHCTCNFFSQWNVCSHTMAIQNILEEILPSEARISEPISST